jgi:hypothetical protein
MIVLMVRRSTNTLSGGFCLFMYVAPSAFYRFFLPDWIVCPVCMFLINAHHKNKTHRRPTRFPSRKHEGVARVLDVERPSL